MFFLVPSGKIWPFIRSVSTFFQLGLDNMSLISLNPSSWILQKPQGNLSSCACRLFQTSSCLSFPPREDTIFPRHLALKLQKQFEFLLVPHFQLITSTSFCSSFLFALRASEMFFLPPAVDLFLIY